MSFSLICHHYTRTRAHTHTHTQLMLLGEGGSVNITDNHGNTPLHLACSNGHEEVNTVERNKDGQSFQWNKKQNAWENWRDGGGVRIEGRGREGYNARLVFLKGGGERLESRDQKLELWSKDRVL